VSETDRTITVTPATLAEKPLIEGLSRFYIYDFSELDADLSGLFAFDAAGRLGPLPGLDDFWGHDGRRALVIRWGDEAAGFALINTHSHLTGGEVEHNMAEFFVARRYRRRGVAMAAVRQILASYPGHWEFAVMARNLAAQAFWPKAIGAAPNVSGIVRHEGDGQHWRGPVWSCDAA